MSKQITRVVLVALISLGIIAAASPNVQARLGSMLRKAEVSNSASAFLFTDKQSQKQGSVSGRDRMNFQFNDFNQSPSRDCNSNDPSQDY